MGKKQHQKDRLFLTSKEWKEEWGGYKDKAAVPYLKLPFHCCAIAFTPFEDPVCTEDGTVFDVTNIVPYINKHHTHPVSGAPLALSDLIPLTFHKNADGEYECPILRKVFTQHSHIVAIRTSGNVFAYDSVQQFNVKLKSWRDLITDEPFTRKDIIHIQNPNDVKVPTTDQFDHVKRGLDAADADEDATVIRNGNATMKKVLAGLKSGGGGGGGGGTVTEPTSRRALAMAQLEAAIQQRTVAKGKTAAHETKGSGAAEADAAATKAADDEEEDDWRLRGPAAKPRGAAFKPGTSTWDTDDAKEAARKVGKRALAEAATAQRADKKARQGRIDPAVWWAEHYRPRFKESVETVGHAARSVTSTTAAVTTRNERVQKLVHRNPKDKGYLTLNTTKGSLNIELRCDVAPRTCENFLALCEMGYYTGCPFHRSIRNFMAQGGDPTGTGTGGDSIYGPTFPDELDSRLLHDRRGVLSMANSGKNTNGSQFFILYKSAQHLNFKHSVFGAVVGGLETLSAIEDAKTDSDDRPLQRIEITGCTIHRNPFRDMIAKEDEAAAAAQAAEGVDASGAVHDACKTGQWYSAPGASVKQLTAPGPATAAAAPGTAAVASAPKPAKKKASAAAASEFDAW